VDATPGINDRNAVEIVGENLPSTFGQSASFPREVVSASRASEVNAVHDGTMAIAIVPELDGTLVHGLVGLSLENDAPLTLELDGWTIWVLKSVPVCEAVEEAVSEPVIVPVCEVVEKAVSELVTGMDFEYNDGEVPPP
jgi:hypothetical protein